MNGRVLANFTDRFLKYLSPISIFWLSFQFRFIPNKYSYCFYVFNAVFMAHA